MKRRGAGASSPQSFPSGVTPRIVATLQRRALGVARGHSCAQRLAVWAEQRSVLARPGNQKYVALPLRTKSTIAIAVSHDGKYFASSHGDHTIKVFRSVSLAPVQVLVGHARTPWSVKFHPQDRDVLASGCLGHEVRVWDVQAGAVLALLRTGGSILSLSFHPDGKVLAIASGRKESTLWGKLELWEWRRPPGNEAAAPGPPAFPALRSPPGLRRSLREEPAAQEAAAGLERAAGGNPVTALEHRFGLRTVFFHPRGDAILMAMANSNPFQATYPTYQLALWKYRGLERLEEAPRILVRQAHLYSDGGLDLSPCGRHLLTCAPPAFGSAVAPPRSAQLLLVSVESGAVLQSAPLDDLFRGRGGEDSPSAVAAADRVHRRGPHPKGVTSVKFSPTQSLAVLGYGVRDPRPGDDTPHVVAAVFRLADMSIISIFTSLSDDVNVARFLPFPGLGCVYGSKQGDVCIISPYQNSGDVQEAGKRVPSPTQAALRRPGPGRPPAARLPPAPPAL